MSYSLSVLRFQALELQNMFVIIHEAYIVLKYSVFWKLNTVFMSYLGKKMYLRIMESHMIEALIKKRFICLFLLSFIVYACCIEYVSAHQLCIKKNCCIDYYVP